MMDNILVYLLKRKIRKLINELNFNTFITASTNKKSPRTIKVGKYNRSHITRDITRLEDAIKVIKN